MCEKATEESRILSSVLPSEYLISRIIDAVIEYILWGCGIIGFLLPLVLFGYIFVEGAHVLSWSFLTDYPRGMMLGDSGGIMPAILGSVCLAADGLLIALPLALGGGIYLSEYSRGSQFSKAVRFFIESLVAVPSIIYGLFGYAFLVVYLKLGISLISGSIVLALIMFPIILITTQESLQSVSNQYREAGLSMGVSKIYLVRRVLLRKACPSIIAGIVLAVGHAVGSASPILFTASIYFSKGDIRLDQPVMALPTHLYHIVSEGMSMDQAFGTALVLIIGLILFNTCALLLRRIGGKHI